MSKGSIEIHEMMAIVAGIVAAAAFLYAATQGLPVDTQTVPTDFTGP